MLKPQPISPPAAPKSASAASLHALVVEDDFVSRCVMQEIMETFGTADVASDGYEALDAFRARLAAGKRYDVVCLDTMMPGMIGHEVLEHMRAIEAEHDIHGLDRVKVVMTTALGSKNYVLGAFRNECDGYVVKPVSLEKMTQTLAMLRLV